MLSIIRTVQLILTAIQIKHFSFQMRWSDVGTEKTEKTKDPGTEDHKVLHGVGTRVRSGPNKLHMIITINPQRETPKDLNNLKFSLENVLN